MSDQNTDHQTDLVPNKINNQNPEEATQDTPVKSFVGQDHLPFSLNFDVSSTVANITHVRKTARSLLESLRISRDCTDAIETLIGELSTNVVRHAYGESHKGTYKVMLELSENHVAITVIDEGVGFTQDAVLPPGTLRSNTLPTEGEERFGGLGLPLIHALADHVEIRANLPHGTTIRAEKRIP